MKRFFFKQLALVLAITMLIPLMGIAEDSLLNEADSLSIDADIVVVTEIDEQPGEVSDIDLPDEENVIVEELDDGDDPDDVLPGEDSIPAEPNEDMQGEDTISAERDEIMQDEDTIPTEPGEDSSGEDDILADPNGDLLCKSIIPAESDEDSLGQTNDPVDPDSMQSDDTENIAGPVSDPSGETQNSDGALEVIDGDSPTKDATIMNEDSSSNESESSDDTTSSNDSESGDDNSKNTLSDKENEIVADAVDKEVEEVEGNSGELDVSTGNSDCYEWDSNLEASENVTVEYAYAFAASNNEPSANQRIFIYDQGWNGEHSQGSNIQIYHWRGWGTLAKYGCGFYTYLHAYQWLTGNVVNTSNSESLIMQMKDGISNLAGTTEWDCTKDNYYANYFSSLGIRKSTPSINIASLSEHFSAGGVVKVYTPDGGSHFNLAIGIIYGDIDNNGAQEYWVHIIDSSAYSTLKALESAGYYSSCYSFNNHSVLSYSQLYGAITNNRSENNGVGLEYWMKYDVFKTCGITAGYLPSENNNKKSADNLKFTNVAYPKTYVMNNKGWDLGSGILESNYDLQSLKTEIVSASGTVISSLTRTISGKAYSIRSLDTYETSDNGVHFSWIKTAGNYKWILTAKDSGNRVLTLEMPFTAVTSGSISTATTSKEYVASSTNNTNNTNNTTSSTTTATTTTATNTSTTTPTTTTTTNTSTTKIIPSCTVTKSARYKAEVGLKCQLLLKGETAKSYKSSNKKILTVSSTGLVTIKAVGTAKITIKTNKRKYTLTIKTYDPTIPTKLSLSVPKTTIKTGGSITLTPVIPKGTNTTYTWKTSNKRVATVANGTVKFKKKGRVIITCIANRGKKKVKVTFRVTQ